MAKAMSMTSPNNGGPEKIDNLSKYFNKGLLTNNLKCLEAKMSNFELDNRISKMVSEKLNDMRERVNNTDKETKANQVNFHRLTEKMNDINVKLEREGKTREMIKDIKAAQLSMVSNL